MAEDEPFGSGVASVFDAIASDREGKPASPAPRPRPRKDAPATVAAPQNDRGDAARPAARIGRFPGSKNGPHKEKITSRITPEMKDAFVKWALDDRCSLQDLVERALIEFFQRYRASREVNK
jgi:hypothetical protein